MKTVTTFYRVTSYQSTRESVSLRAYIDEKKKGLILKRAFDIVFSTIIILGVLTWLIPLIALFILIDSRGPIFFIQRRVGKAGKTFRCLKFRTMVLNSDANTLQAQENDYRITRVGNFLRKSNLDEFPQFLNVLIGDMSIVGPRPHMLADCKRFSDAVPGYKFRNLLKPGITGLAQVKGYRGLARDFSSIFRRFQFDAFYVRNWNFWLDLRIIRNTASQTITLLLNRKLNYTHSDAYKLDKFEKRQLFTANYAITDYQNASDIIIKNAKSQKSYGVSALAVHGLIETVRKPSFRTLVNKIDMVVPDGQPVKWALNSFYRTGLKDRVAGPILTKVVLEKANQHKLGIFLYGSTEETLDKFTSFIKDNYPSITISGIHADRFREATEEEDLQDIEKINASGANIVLVGRGCPRQEKWVANHIGKINAVMMAVGAAFDFHAGNISLAPEWMQKAGLEWFFRLMQEPEKLWRRYLTTNPHFICLFVMCKLGLRKVAFT